MNAKYNNIRIDAMSAVLPQNMIDNDEAASNNEHMQKVINMTGVHRRHVMNLDNRRVMDYAVEAGRIALEKSGYKKEDVEFLLYITQSPDFFGPSTALPIQKELGLTVRCMAFDMNLGCTGFVAGMQVLSSLMMSSSSDKCVGMLIIADSLATEPREVENDALLFGDAATAIVLSKQLCSEMFVSYSSDGARYKTISKKISDTKTYMDGDAVFQFSISEVPKYIIDFINYHALSDKGIDYFVPHQAQDFIIKHISRKIGIPAENVLKSLGDYGNTSGSSIPVTLCANKDVLDNKTKILASGFGVGLAWGIIYFTIDKDVITGVHFL